MAQHGVANERAFEIDARLSAVGPEVLAGAVAPERDAVAHAAKVAGRLGNEQNRRGNRSVRGSNHGATSRDVRAAPTCDGVVGEPVEGRFGIHSVSLVDTQSENFALQPIVTYFHAHGEHAEFRKVATTLVDKDIAVGPVVVAVELADHRLPSLGEWVRFPKFRNHVPCPSAAQRAPRWVPPPPDAMLIVPQDVKEWSQLEERMVPVRAEWLLKALWETAGELETALTNVRAAESAAHPVSGESSLVELAGRVRDHEIVTGAHLERMAFFGASTHTRHDLEWLEPDRAYE